MKEKGCFKFEHQCSHTEQKNNSAELFTLFTKEILNGKLYFLCSARSFTRQLEELTTTQMIHILKEA